MNETIWVMSLQILLTLTLKISETIWVMSLQTLLTLTLMKLAFLDGLTLYLWLCELTLYFDVKLCTMLYFGHWVYFAFIIKSYYALLAILF